MKSPESLDAKCGRMLAIADAIEAWVLREEKIDRTTTAMRYYTKFCENPCDTSTIIKEKDHFVSSKQKTEPGMHGIGMHSINAIADRDEGRVEFYIESNTFYAKVVLPYLNERGKYQ